MSEDALHLRNSLPDPAPVSNDAFFLKVNDSLLTAKPEDDLLHPAQNAKVVGDSSTETQYFGFNVPEHDIHGMCYMWHHPNLGVVTGGLMVWQGRKAMSVAAELFDLRGYHNDKILKGDLHEFRLDNGYGVKIIEPNKRFHLTYADEKRDNRVDLNYEAVTPVVMFGDGKHFEQGMRVKGQLTLRGKSYEVDGYNVRDRSWGKLRSEDIMPLPPVSWMTGWFGDDLIFNCNLMDHEGSNPQVTGAFAMPVEKSLNGGWMWRDGKVQRVVKANKTVQRDPVSFVPLAITLNMTTEDGHETTAVGRMIASCPWATWPNIMAHINLIHWECEGRSGHGDCQDVLWNDFVVSASAA